MVELSPFSPATCQRLIVKVGSSLLVTPEGEVRRDWLAALAADIAAAVRGGQQIAIVSSGAIGSPRLLMHSGIGPADHLESVGIRAVHDLPGVGGNLQDHLDLFVIAECTGDHTYDKYNKLHHAAWAGLQYLLLKKGPVASSLFETGGFWYADGAPSAAVRSPGV